MVQTKVEKAEVKKVWVVALNDEVGRNEERVKQVVHDTEEMETGHSALASDGIGDEEAALTGPALPSDQTEEMETEKNPTLAGDMGSDYAGYTGAEETQEATDASLFSGGIPTAVADESRELTVAPPTPSSITSDLKPAVLDPEEQWEESIRERRWFTLQEAKEELKKNKPNHVKYIERMIQTKSSATPATTAASATE